MRSFATILKNKNKAKTLVLKNSLETKMNHVFRKQTHWMVELKVILICFFMLLIIIQFSFSASIITSIMERKKKKAATVATFWIAFHSTHPVEMLAHLCSNQQGCCFPILVELQNADTHLLRWTHKHGLQQLNGASCEGY